MEWNGIAIWHGVSDHAWLSGNARAPTLPPSLPQITGTVLNDSIHGVGADKLRRPCAQVAPPPATHTSHHTRAHTHTQTDP